MTEQEKQLLLVDLCARLPYGVKIQLKNTYCYHCDKMCNIGDFTIDEIKSVDKKGEYIKIYHNDPLDYEWYIDDIEIEDMKPYLRPMSSMTNQEIETYRTLIGSLLENSVTDNVATLYNFLNSKHLDYRGMIRMGLALEAKEGMYES